MKICLVVLEILRWVVSSIEGLSLHGLAHSEESYVSLKLKSYMEFEDESLHEVFI